MNIRSSISPLQRRPLQNTAPKGDITSMLQELLRVAPQILKAHAEMKTMHDNITNHVSSVKQGPPGREGAPGRHAQAPEIDYEKIVEGLSRKIKLPTNGKDGRPGRDGKSINPDEIVEHIVKNKKLKAKDIDGWQDANEIFRRFVGRGSLHGSGDTVTPGSNITITTDANGKKVINALTNALSGTQEKSTTTPNGVLTTFAFTHTPTLIIWNGAIQTLTDDYTAGANSITFTASAGIPQTGDKIINIYA